MCCKHSKSLTWRFYYTKMSPKDADGIANSEDPEQTASQGSGTALFSRNIGIMFENIGSRQIVC